MFRIHQLLAAVAALSLAHVAAAGAAEPSKQDTKYMSKTAQGLISEVALGKMAQERAGDERVKAFGKRMVDDHGKDLQQLKQLAAEKNVTLPGAPDSEQTREADKLGKLSGKDFDAEYVKYEAKDHKDDVKDQGKEMKSSADPELKKFATAAYATVSGHKKIIDDLQSRLHGK